MTQGFQPFLISEFKSGIDTYLEPWIRPPDAFEPLVNAFVYRGSIRKRYGSSQLGNQLEDQTPVMGLMQRIDEATGNVFLVAASQLFAYEYVAGGNTFDVLTSVGGASSIFWSGTATGTIITPTFWPYLTPSTISISDGTTTITDDGSGNLSSGGIFAAGGTINYTSGIVTLNFVGTTALTNLTLVATVAGPGALPNAGYFTGKIKNFFNWTNWQPTDPAGLTESKNNLYMTNGVDAITLFDGTFLSRPVFYVTQNVDPDTGVRDYIKTTFDVNVFQNRLLAFKPTLNSFSQSLNQTIYYSAIYSPLDFVADVAGRGGFFTAATGDILVSEDFLRNDIVLNFSNSTWLLRSTGIQFNPFRLDKITSIKTNNCPYASVSYDERTTSLGSKGMTACDGANVSRYDVKIIDYYQNEIDQQYFSQCFAQRYDNLNQTWMLYPSVSNLYPVLEGGAPGSDKALIYNFVEENWATFTFPSAMTCLGTFYEVTGTTWASLTREWQSVDRSWTSYANQQTSQTIIGGDTSGNIYDLSDDGTPTDYGNPIIIDLVSTRWNPIIQSGQKVQFGWVDIYYYISEVFGGDPINVTLNFYVDNSNLVAASRNLTLDGPIQGQYAWKRVYMNIVGEFIQMEIDPNKNSWMQFLGFILWVRPAGRFTPGLTV